MLALVALEVGTIVGVGLELELEEKKNSRIDVRCAVHYASLHCMRPAKSDSALLKVEEDLAPIRTLQRFAMVERRTVVPAARCRIRHLAERLALRPYSLVPDGACEYVIGVVVTVNTDDEDGDDVDCIAIGVVGDESRDRRETK
jgi:hypothetical protein